jgi:hypothetical protein
MHLSPIEIFWLGVAGGWIAAAVCFWVFGWVATPSIMTMSNDTLEKFARDAQRELHYRFPSRFKSPVRLPTDPP